MNARRLIPYRLRHASRVVSIQCRLCDRWCKPRHIRIPAMVCRDCETTDAFQTWTRTRTVARRAMAVVTRGGTR